MEMNSQTLTYDTSQLQVSYTERIKKRLESLAAPPSSVVVVPSSYIPEPAESIATAATGTANTEPVDGRNTAANTEPTDGRNTTANTEPVDGRNTAATSVLSLPRVFSVQKFYASPSTPMDEGLQAVWTHQIFDRLNQTLRVAVPTGTCLQEFMHMGRRANALKPTLVINCGDAHIKRQVERTFKTQIWLQEILKAKGIMFIALVVKISPSAGPVSSHATAIDLIKAYAIHAPPSGIDTSCGSRLTIRVKKGFPSRSCTLGGLIIVSGAVVGLTAGHPFRTFDQHASSDPAQVAEDLDDDESSGASSEPFVFNEDDDDTSDTSKASSLPLHVDVDDSRADDDDSTALYNENPTLPPSTGWQRPYSVICSVPTEKSTSFGNDHGHDWALLKDLPLAIRSRPNWQTYTGSHHSTISEITPSGTCGSVVINVLGNGPRRGYLHSSPTSMKVGMCVLGVQLITMERALRRSLPR
ncbi:MAG: hypothetical protein L6R38_002355 [Xanthoria sp. 2 TBL-2021]|nr:MAG: hypothetical protein L6R38_002355 [Xanthoria sp. 2 TBL-2021]